MDRLQSFRGIANNTPGIDLVTVDIPDNLAIPNISMANGEVPTWNVEKAGFLDTNFWLHQHSSSRWWFSSFISYMQPQVDEDSEGFFNGLMFQDPQGVDGCQPVEDDY
jgi:hypothetical protein